MGTSSDYAIPLTALPSYDGKPDDFVADVWAFIRSEIQRIAGLWLPSEVQGGLDDYLLGASANGAPWRLEGDAGSWTLWVRYDNPGGCCSAYQRICTHWTEGILAHEGPSYLNAIADQNDLNDAELPFDLEAALERAGRVPMIALRGQPWEVSVGGDEAELELVGNDASLRFSELDDRERACVRAMRERKVCVCGLCLRHLGLEAAVAINDLLD